MSKRFQANREYADCLKTRTPFCSLNCCGNSFGIHSGKVKRLTRRYHRHSVKVTTKELMEEYIKERIEEYLEACQELESYGF